MAVMAKVLLNLAYTLILVDTWLLPAPSIWDAEDVPYSVDFYHMQQDSLLNIDYSFGNENGEESRCIWSMFMASILVL